MPFDLREFLSEIMRTSRTLRDRTSDEHIESMLLLRLKSITHQTMIKYDQIKIWEHTFPTAEKKSSRSRGLILAASCMQNTVRASLSSGVRLSIGCLQNKSIFSIWHGDQRVKNVTTSGRSPAQDCFLPYWTLVFPEGTSASGTSPAEIISLKIN